jgi:molybdopterin/thiamine biosynthesis adenylyltransferase
VSGFDYNEAFSRNLGWVTEAEQESLHGKRVAVAGLGGVGGFHVTTFARLGIGAFNLADFDTFGLVNFNRQAGATMSTLDRPKIDVISEMARDINPTAGIKRFPQGVSADNIDEFLSGVDLYIDGLDFFAFKVRVATFAACARLAVPAITSAPLGMGVAHLNFLPGGMTFEEYFGLEGQPEFEQGLRFLLGLSPAMLQSAYLIDPARINLDERRGPSTVMGCMLCAGMAATQGLKILLNREDIVAAPRGLHFDAYRGELAQTIRLGKDDPDVLAALAVARQQFTQPPAAGEGKPQ